MLDKEIKCGVYIETAERKTLGNILQNSASVAFGDFPGSLLSQG